MGGDTPLLTELMSCREEWRAHGAPCNCVSALGATSIMVLALPPWVPWRARGGAREQRRLLRRRVLAASRTRGARALHTYGALVRPTDRGGRCGVSCIGRRPAVVCCRFGSTMSLALVVCRERSERTGREHRTASPRDWRRRRGVLFGYLACGCRSLPGKSGAVCIYRLLSFGEIGCAIPPFS